MKRSDFRFFDRLRVRWSEVDMQKIVFNGHYLMYFDVAVAAYWRALAMPYHDTMQALSGDLFVRKASVEYLGSARYEDLCDVGLRCARIGNSSMTMVAALFRGEQLLVHGELVYVFADPETQTSKPVPATLRAVLDAYEAGEAMYRVLSPDWAAAGEAASAIRHAVFAQEQGVPASLMVDDADVSGNHALVVNRFDSPIASGRLVVSDAATDAGANDENARANSNANANANASFLQGKIGRMAVLQAVRGSGVGSALLAALMAKARSLQVQEVMLYAQVSAVPFYRAHGFASRGGRFMEAGIEHQEMFIAP